MRLPVDSSLLSQRTSNLETSCCILAKSHNQEDESVLLFLKIHLLSSSPQVKPNSCSNTVALQLCNPLIK